MKNPDKIIRRTRGTKGNPKPCLVCGAVTPYTYCAEHARNEVRYADAKRSKHQQAVHRARRLRATSGHCEWPGCEWADPTGKTLELDHKLSIENGGADSYENKWLLCLDHHKNKTSIEQSQSKSRAHQERKPPQSGNPMQR